MNLKKFIPSLTFCLENPPRNTFSKVTGFMVQRQGLENSFIPAEVSSILVIFLTASLMDTAVIFMKMEKFSFVENGITENFLRVNYSLKASFPGSFQVINSKSILDGAVVHDYKL